VLLVNALLLILFLSDTYGGRTHDKPIADATPYPLPAGSRLLQDLGFLAFMLPEVAILMPSKKPRGQELTREQQRANQALNQRRLRIEHVNSSVKRCRIVKDRLRLWKQGVRDLVMELCCALHNFRVRLKPNGVALAPRTLERTILPPERMEVGLALFDVEELVQMRQHRHG
jgi:DDE superfamily endonuclease